MKILFASILVATAACTGTSNPAMGCPPATLPPAEAAQLDLSSLTFDPNTVVVRFLPKPTLDASIDVDCGHGGSFKLSTGNGVKSAVCYAEFVDGKLVSAYCNDQKGNYADMNCESGCERSGGSGSCSKK